VAVRSALPSGTVDRADPKLLARAISSMVSRMACIRYVQGVGTASAQALARTSTRVRTNALGITTRHLRTKRS
jgi:hypothetical protein